MIRHANLSGKKTVYTVRFVHDTPNTTKLIYFYFLYTIIGMQQSTTNLEVGSGEEQHFLLNLPKYITAFLFPQTSYVPRNLSHFRMLPQTFLAHFTAFPTVVLKSARSANNANSAVNS